MGCAVPGREGHFRLGGQGRLLISLMRARCALPAEFTVPEVLAKQKQK